ncbi:MAG: tetratricopeptide repeat protein [Pseudomonadales bacterium]
MDSKSPAAQITFDVSPDNFQSGVVERSRQVPVVLLFWAPEVLPSAEIRRDLENLVKGYGGKVLLGLVDVSRDPTLAQHLRVQGLPSIRVVQDGQLVHQLDGPQPESALRGLLDQLTMSSAELLREDLATLLEAGEFDRALQFLRQAIQEEPQNQGFQVELADLLARQGDVEQARRVLDAVPEGTDERDRPQARIEFLEEAAGLPAAEELQARLAGDGGDLEARYGLAVRAAAAGDYQPALDQALAILQADRTFRDDLGRLTMIRVFKLMGKGSELASQYRRRMFNFMH